MQLPFVRLREAANRWGEKGTTRHQESDEDVDEGNAAQSKTKKRVSSVSDEEVYDDDEEYDKETPIDDPPTSKQKVKSTPVSSQHTTSDFTTNNGVKEGTFRQGSRTNNAAPSKTRRRASPVHDDEDDEDSEYHTAPPPVVDPVASSEQQQPKKKKKKKPISTPNEKVRSTPMSPQYSISGFTFANGSGNMVNNNVGNIHDLTIEDAFNDNSVNTFYAGERRKPAA